MSIQEGYLNPVVPGVISKPFLYVEDDKASAKVMKKVFERNFPHLALHIVNNAFNAKKALYGEDFYLWDPMKDTYEKLSRILFEGVIWDNQFPAAQGDAASADMGIQTAQEVALSGKVSAAVCSRFAAHSADVNQQKFTQAGVFSSIMPKPIQLQTLKNTMMQWGLVPGEDLKEQQ